MIRVAGLSRQLAERHGGDADKAELAALYHDSMREAEREVLDRMMIQSGMPDYYLGNRNLSHGRAAAVMMERDYDITDPDLLDPVAYHTTGRPGMSLAEKILYVADYMEPNRDFPGVERLRAAVDRDLDLAVLLGLEMTVEMLRHQGRRVARDSLEAIESLRAGCAQ